MNTRTWLIASLSAVAVLAGCATSAPEPETVVDTIAHTPNLSVAAKLIKDADLAATLSGTGPFTVFVPSDDAFKALSPAELKELQGNKELLKSVLTYHVIPAQITTAAVPRAGQKTVNGGDVSLSKAGTITTIESAIVTQADIKASNGMVNVIDTVLMPPKKR